MTFTYPIRGEKFAFSVQGEVLADVTSEFQRIQVVDTECFGKALLLDGHIQLTELDESAYHEALVQIPLLSMYNPKRALVIGGGDGGVVRELCKNQDLTQIDMVEIDQRVIDVCREHLPTLSGKLGAPNVNVYITDAAQFVEESKTKYDLIVADCTDTYEGEDGALSEALFGERFYQDCYDRLTEDGMLVTQADNPVFCPYSLTAIQTMLGKVFPHLESYWVAVPSFGGYSAFCIASKGAKLARTIDAKSLQGMNYLTSEVWALSLTRQPFTLV